MNRTDRLHALTEELRRAGSRGRTAAALARLFEVSTRTVKRDVSALQQAGVPVWAQAGPGGGYVLDAAATLPPVNLTPGQATAVAVALAAHAGGPFAADGRAAREKLLDVMDQDARVRAEQLAARLWVRGEEATASASQRAVEQALHQRRVLALDYVDGRGQATRRHVEPHLLARNRGHWYLVGWCRDRDAPRWFRLDRLQAAHLTAEPSPERDPAAFGTPPPDARPVRHPRPAP